MSGGELVAVVVTHNRLKQLRVTIARLLDSPPAQLKAIVVIDNASTDETLAWLREQSDRRLDILRMEKNIGGAGGFAAGMKHARDNHDPDWIVVMDDDARPAPGALAAFHSAQPARWDATAAAVYFPDGRICEMNRPSRNPFWHPREFLATIFKGRAGFHLQPEAYEESTPVEIDVTSFVGFFISRDGLARAGMPDPGLFLYGDDGLYTLGLRRNGGSMAFLPQVRFEHDCHTFGAEQRGRFKPLWKAYYYHRNLLMLYRQAAGWAFWPALLLILPRWFAKARAHRGERRVFCSLLLRAIRDGLGGRSSIAHATIIAWATPVASEK